MSHTTQTKIPSEGSLKAAHEAYMDKVYEDRLAQGLDPHTGEETDD